MDQLTPHGIDQHQTKGEEERCSTFQSCPIKSWHGSSKCLLRSKLLAMLGVLVGIGGGGSWLLRAAWDRDGVRQRRDLVEEYKHKATQQTAVWSYPVSLEGEEFGFRGCW